MYGGSVGGRLVEKFNSVRESAIRIVGAESGERRKARIAFDANTVFDKDSGGASGVQQREVAAVWGKRGLGGGGGGHAGKASEFGGGVGLEGAGKIFLHRRRVSLWGSEEF